MKIILKNSLILENGVANSKICFRISTSIYSRETMNFQIDMGKILIIRRTVR